MSLSLICACGARFEVEDTFAGQAVSCPECQQQVQVPSGPTVPLRTSGYAVASIVAALIGAFTGIGTLIAIILALLAFADISRRRQQVTGTGYAMFGLICGVLFTVLFGLSFIRSDLFGMDGLRESMLGNQVDRTGPMEIVREVPGYAITRPTSKWGVMKPQLAEIDLMIANPSKDVYLDVAKYDLFGRDLEAFRDDLLDTFKEDNGVIPSRQLALTFRGLVVQKNQRLEDTPERETIEVLLDVKLGNQPLTYVLRVIHPVGTKQVYVMRSWVTKRRFLALEPEIRQGIDSFRLLKN